MSDEPLLKEDSRTFSLFPLKYPEIWSAYKKICTTFWTAEEVDLETDKRHFETKLTQGEKHYLCTVLAFFSSADSIVNLNLLNNFCSEIKVPEAGCFLAFQAAQENIHAEVYSLLIDRLCDKDEGHVFQGEVDDDGVFQCDTKGINSDSSKLTYRWKGQEGTATVVKGKGFRLTPAKKKGRRRRPTDEEGLHVTVSRKEFLFDALLHMPAIKKKGEWALSWADGNKRSFPERLVAWAVVEGLLFSSSFASIAWFKHRGLLPGVGTVNEWISRDESCHADFACMLLRSYVKHRPSTETVHTIFREAVEIEDEFVETSLPVSLIGIDAKEMKQYVRYCANRLLKAMNYPEMFENAKSPWKFINLLSVTGMTSFFEKKVADYAKSTLNKSQISFDATF